MNAPRPDRVLELGEVNRLVAGRHGYFLANRYDRFVGLALVRYGEYGELEWRPLAKLVGPGTTAIEDARVLEEFHEITTLGAHPLQGVSRP